MWSRSRLASIQTFTLSSSSQGDAEVRPQAGGSRHGEGGTDRDRLGIVRRSQTSRRELTERIRSAEPQNWSRREYAAVDYASLPVLGHSSIYITKDVYGHLVEGAKRDAAERMAAALSR